MRALRIPTHLMTPLIVSACAVSNTKLEEDTVLLSNDPQAKDPYLNSADDEGATTIAVEGLITGAQSTDMTTQREIETVGLLFMREVEKLAQDRYLALYDIWGTPLFGNIAAIKRRLPKRSSNSWSTTDCEDPAQATLPGEFQVPTLQERYDQLLTRGLQSRGEALLVRSFVEEMDILDVEEYISQTNLSLIVTVHASLMAGSRNHLRAFANLSQSRIGLPYSPQYLDKNQLYELLATVIRRSRRGRLNW